MALSAEFLSLSVRNENPGALPQTTASQNSLHQVWNTVFEKLQAITMFFKDKNSVCGICGIEVNKHI